MSLSLATPISYPSGAAFGIPDVKPRLLDAATNYLRQALNATEVAPAIPVKQKDWFSLVDNLPLGIRMTPLRGLRITPGVLRVLQIVGKFAGPHGDRFFMNQRTLAHRVGRSRRLVGEALRLGVATGLLIRHTHGAGGSRKPGAYKKQGASYQLAFPGGEEGITEVRTWLDNRFEQGRRLSAAERRRRTRVEESENKAEQFIRANPDMVREIAHVLGQPPDREGAIRVAARVFYRARRKIHHPRKYVLHAVQNDVRTGGDLTECFPPLPTQGANHAQAVIAQMVASLHKPPDF